jgi:hypothetical protein
MDISTSKIDIKLEKFKKYLHVMKENEKKNKRSVQFINYEEESKIKNSIVYNFSKKKNKCIRNSDSIKNLNNSLIIVPHKNKYDDILEKENKIKLFEKNKEMISKKQTKKNDLKEFPFWTFFIKNNIDFYGNISNDIKGNKKKLLIFLSKDQQQTYIQNKKRFLLKEKLNELEEEKKYIQLKLDKILKSFPDQEMIHSIFNNIEKYNRVSIKNKMIKNIIPDVNKKIIEYYNLYDLDLSRLCNYQYNTKYYYNLNQNLNFYQNDLNDHLNKLNNINKGINQEMIYIKNIYDEAINKMNQN